MALLLLLLTCTSAHTPSPAQPHRKAGTCKLDLPLQAVFAESCVSRRVEGRNICDTTTRTSEPFRVTSEALQCLRNTKTIFTLWIVQLSVVTSSPYLVNNIFLLEKKNHSQSNVYNQQLSTKTCWAISCLIFFFLLKTQVILRKEEPFHMRDFI